MSSEVKSGIGRRDAIATMVGGLVAASAAPARAADAKAKPILLYCDLKVDPGRESEMLEHFHQRFKPV